MKKVTGYLKQAFLKFIKIICLMVIFITAVLILIYFYVIEKNISKNEVVLTQLINQFEKEIKMQNLANLKQEELLIKIEYLNHKFYQQTNARLDEVMTDYDCVKK